MRYLSSGDIVRGYITGGLKYSIRPPDWNRSILCLRLKDFKSGDIRVNAYRRFVKYSYNVTSTHLNARQIMQLIGEKTWKDYYTFTFERNPYDRMISFYHWRIKDLKKPPSFDEFIDALFLKKETWLKKNNLDGYSNLPFYMDNNGICVDHVAMFENLLPEVEYIFNRIGLKFDGWLPFEKKGVRPKEASEKNLYNDQNIKKMERIFSKEIELFKYTPYP
jgi:hypothetical protein